MHSPDIFHRHAAPGVKSRLFQPVAFKVQAGAAWISGRDFDFTVGVADANRANFIVNVFLVNFMF